jgi:hypothetical protein
MAKYQTCSDGGIIKVTEFEPCRSVGAHRKSGSVEKQAKR